MSAPKILLFKNDNPLDAIGRLLAAVGRSEEVLLYPTAIPIVSSEAVPILASTREIGAELIEHTPNTAPVAVRAYSLPKLAAFRAIDAAYKTKTGDENSNRFGLHVVADESGQPKEVHLMIATFAKLKLGEMGIGLADLIGYVQAVPARNFKVDPGYRNRFLSSTAVPTIRINGQLAAAEVRLLPSTDAHNAVAYKIGNLMAREVDDPSAVYAPNQITHVG